MTCFRKASVDVFSGDRCWCSEPKSFLLSIEHFNFYNAVISVYTLEAFEKSYQNAGCGGTFLAYRRKRSEIKINKRGPIFLRNCQMNYIIPRFLKFRVPENGYFEERNVHNFQKTLLRREIAKASRKLETQQAELVSIRKKTSGFDPFEINSLSILPPCLGMPGL